MSTALRNPSAVRLAGLAALAVALLLSGPGGGARPGERFENGRLTEVELSGLMTGAERPWQAGTVDQNRRETLVAGEVFGGKLRLAARLARDSGVSEVRLSVYLVNKNGWFYKSAGNFLLTHRRLRKIEIDLSPDSPDLIPAGSARPWGETSGTALRRIGLAVFASRGYSGGVEVREARIVGGSSRDTIAFGKKELSAEGLAVHPPSPGAGDLVELAFGFPVAFANPFDPEVADLRAEIAFPDGARLTVPAYFDQDFAPVREGFEVRAVPVGPGRWKVRFRARTRGSHKVALFWAREKFADVPVEVGRARKRRRAAGLIRTDSQYLQKLATVYDESFLRLVPADSGRGRAVWRSGRFELADPQPGMLAGWVAPLEWTSQWGRWLGLGRYNLETAWKLELALERAARIGVKRPLLLNFDGLFAAGGRHPLDFPDRRRGGAYLQSGRYRWAFNPLSSRLGGPLTGPSQYFTNSRAEKAAKSLFRYLAARYGQHPAVDGLVLGAAFPAEGVAKWHGRVGGYLAACLGPGGNGLKLSALHPQAVAMKKNLAVGSFEAGAGRGWRFDKTICPTAKGGYSQAVRSEGRRSLKVEADFPGEAFCLLRQVDDNFGEYQQLSFDAYLPPETPRDLHVRAMVYLRDRELNWYEVLLPGELRRGDWTKLLMDLRPGRSGLAGVGHGRPWDDYSRQRIKVVGLRFFAVYDSTSAKKRRATYRGPLFVDNVKFSGRPAAGRPEPKLAVLDLKEHNTDEPETFTKVEYTFRLNRAFLNPFDPECVEVRARMLTPSGKLVTMPGFFYQGYRRRLAKQVTAVDFYHKKRTVPAPNGAEVLDPLGGSLWKVRLAAGEPGRHIVEIEVRIPDGKGEMKVAARKKGLTFNAVKGSRRGYVRLAADGRHFEHSGGEFFFPLGMAIRSPSDARDLRRDKTIRDTIRGEKPVLLHDWGKQKEYLDLIQARGTYQFDDYFAECQKAGINWARVWMCPWWLGLEWDHRYPGYEGAGRYNLANAWRMDHLLERAEKHGMFLQLCLTNHGQVTARIDRQWDFNPYNRVMPKQLYNQPDRQAEGPFYKRPGGFLRFPEDWFKDERARKLTRNRLRYTVARWGYSPNIMGFALMSEVEFTGGTTFRNDRGWDGRLFPLQTKWHKEMAEHLRTIDPYRHLITTHFSHPQNGRDVWQTRSLDYVQSNAYSAFSWLGGNPNKLIGAPLAMQRYYHGHPPGGFAKGMKSWRRPVVVGEWGGDWMGSRGKPRYGAVLSAELHTGLWAQTMLPMAGATGYWWWLHVHYNKRYGTFAAVARFVKGEDLRGVTRQLKVGNPQGPGAGSLRVMAIGDGKSRAYAYVYSQKLIRSLKDKPAFSDITLNLGGLQAGTYTVEFWDTFAGKRVSTATAVTKGGPLPVKLPAFKGDLALKVRRTGAPRATSTGTHGTQPPDRGRAAR